MAYAWLSVRFFNFFSSLFFFFYIRQSGKLLMPPGYCSWHRKLVCWTLAIGNFLPSYSLVACKMRMRPIYMHGEQSIYARGRWKFYSKDGSRWAPLTWIRNSLCRSRKQACRITTKRAPWANSINYIPLRRNCTPYVFDFKGVSSSRVAVSHACLTRSDAVKMGRKRNNPHEAPRQCYKIRELHFRKEGRGPDEDPARNLLTEEWSTFNLSIHLPRLIAPVVYRSLYIQ